MTTAYPLTWPDGRPRMPDYKRTWSRFKTSFASARDECLSEISLLGGRDVIISSNLPLRQDGLPLANARPMRGDPAVAVYFTYKKRPMCFACDRWAKVEDNMHAIALTIGALRGVARWGTGDMMEAAFTGFTALPAPGQTARGWREVLGLDPRLAATESVVTEAYRRMRSAHHPDKNGSAVMFDAVQKAYEQARAELGF